MLIFRGTFKMVFASTSLISSPSSQLLHGAPLSVEPSSPESNAPELISSQLSDTKAE